MMFLPDGRTSPLHREPLHNLAARTLERPTEQSSQQHDIDGHVSSQCPDDDDPSITRKLHDTSFPGAAAQGRASFVLWTLKITGPSVAFTCTSPLNLPSDQSMDRKQATWMKSSGPCWNGHSLAMR